MALINKRIDIDINGNESVEYSGSIGKYYQTYIDIKKSVQKILKSNI